MGLASMSLFLPLFIFLTVPQIYLIVTACLISFYIFHICYMHSIYDSEFSWAPLSPLAYEGFALRLCRLQLVWRAFCRPLVWGAEVRLPSGKAVVVKGRRAP